MQKLIIACLLGLSYITNSLSMLHQKHLIHRVTARRHTKSFCTHNDLLQKNNALLQKIIDQNEVSHKLSQEHNNFLRAILQNLYDTVEKEHDITIKLDTKPEQVQKLSPLESFLINP